MVDPGVVLQRLVISPRPLPPILPRPAGELQPLDADQAVARRWWRSPRRKRGRRRRAGQRSTHAAARALRLVRVRGSRQRLQDAHAAPGAFSIRFSPASIPIRASRARATRTISSRRASCISRASRSSAAPISCTGRRSGACSIARRSCTSTARDLARHLRAGDPLPRRHVLHDHHAHRSRRQLHRDGDESSRPVVGSDLVARGRRHRSLALLRRRRPSVHHEQRPAGRDAAVQRPPRDLGAGVRRRQQEDGRAEVGDRERRRGPREETDLDRGAAHLQGEGTVLSDLRRRRNGGSAFGGRVSRTSPLGPYAPYSGNPILTQRHSIRRARSRSRPPATPISSRRRTASGGPFSSARDPTPTTRTTSGARHSCCRCVGSTAGR